MSPAPRTMIDRSVAAINAGDPDAMAALFSEDATYEDHRALAWETLEGRDAIRSMFASIMEYSPSISSEVLAERGDRVVVCQTVIASFDEAAGGGAGEVEVHLCITVRGDLMTHVEVFPDRESALAALDSPSGPGDS